MVAPGIHTISASPEEQDKEVGETYSLSLYLTDTLNANIIKGGIWSGYKF